MNERRMIENSDRGITLNKQLAWTIGVGLICAGLYVGLTIATLSTQMEQSRAIGARGRILAIGRRIQRIGVFDAAGGAAGKVGKLFTDGKAHGQQQGSAG